MRIKQMKVGDKVKVDGIGGFYSTYKDWAEIVGAERWVKNKYPENMEFVIKVIAPHLTESIMLYLLSNDEGDFIFDGIDSNITIVKPRTRTEYEKVEYNHAWEVVKLREEGVELFKTASDELKIERINSIALRASSGYDFYRKVEKEIDERQEFIGRAKDLIDASKDADYSLGSMYDAGCRFVGANGEIE